MITPALDRAIYRNIPLSVLRELNKLHSGEFLPVFIEIRHPTLPDALRFVADNVDYVYDGKTYLAYPFRISLLNDTDNLPTAQLTVSNINQEIERAIIDATDPPTISVFVTDGSSFDMTVKPRTQLSVNILTEVHDLYLVEINGDAVQLSGKLVTWSYTAEPYPFIRATQERTPSIFR